MAAAELVARLRAHAAGDRGSILSRFGSEAGRRERLSIEVGPLLFDWSRTDLDEVGLGLLGALVEARGVMAAAGALAAGDRLNASEGRSATHMAERGTGAAALVAAAAAREAEMLALAEQLRGEGHCHVLHIGIGGSALGPALLLDALPGDGKPGGPAVEVVSNIDGVALTRACARCDPARTLVVVVSKTFTTLETMTNAASAMEWLAAAGIAEPRARVVAVTAAPDRARAWGAGHVLAFAETVGGRYSLWSSVALPWVLQAGPAALAALKAGAAMMDRHFLESRPERNAPLLAAMADYWAHHLLGQPVRGVFAYDERLRLLPAYLQQLEMESNGKGVSAEGKPLAGMTAPVTWGGVGTDAQHAVFQLLHQGTVVGPVELLAVREAGHGLPGHHAQLLANCLAQGAALLAGRDHADPARRFAGNRPSATILLERLDAFGLGALIAFYEARTFALAMLLGVNPFDQWGVELGKDMARAMLAGTREGFDPSSAALAERLL